MTAINEVQASAALSFGQSALKSENYSEAHAYFTHVLETEPENAEALMGKGLAAGWQSNLRHSRLSEMLEMYRKVKYVVPAGSPIPAEMAAGMLEVLMAYDRLSREHTMEFIAVDYARYEAFDRAEEVLMVLDALRHDHVDLSQEFINPMMIRILKAQIGTSGCMGDQLSRFKSMLQTLTQETPSELKKIEAKRHTGLFTIIVFACMTGVGYALHWLIEPESIGGWIAVILLASFGVPILLIHGVSLFMKLSTQDKQDKGPGQV